MTTEGVRKAPVGGKRERGGREASRFPARWILAGLVLLLAAVPGAARAQGRGASASPDPAVSSAAAAVAVGAPAGAEVSAEQPPGTTDPAAELVQPEAGPPVDLETAFEYARARHPMLQSVRVELDKADAQLAQAWGNLLPRVSGQIMYTLNDQATVVDLGGELAASMGIEMEPVVMREQHIAQSQLQIAAPLFNMPIYTAIRMGRLGRGVAMLSEEEASRQLLTGVATAFYGALAARELIDLQADSFRFAKQHLAAAQARLDAGAGIRIDVARAELEVETARMNHQSAVLGYDRAREALSGLLVMDELPLPVVPEEDPPAPGSTDDLVARALENRPDAAIKEALVDLAEENLWMAWSAFFPTLNVAWQLQTELTEPSGFGGRRNVWALVFILAVPLYDQSRYGLLDQRRAEIRQAEINVEAVRLQIETDIRSAIREYESYLATISTAERQLELAQEALGLAEAGFRAGAATSLDVDDAQQRVNAARINVTVQKYQSRMALVKLLFLAGEVPGGE